MQAQKILLAQLKQRALKQYSAPTDEHANSNSNTPSGTSKNNNNAPSQYASNFNPAQSRASFSAAKDSDDITPWLGTSSSRSSGSSSSSSTSHDAKDADDGVAWETDANETADNARGKKLAAGDDEVEEEEDEAIYG